MKKIILIFFCLASFLMARSKNDSTLTDAYRPGDHELLLMPSAYTMQKGQSYFSDYELVLINYTYAITSRTHLSVFSLFPITSDFIRTLTLGIKQNYYRTDVVASAAWVTYTPDNGLLNIGNVLSIGHPGRSLHFGIGALTSSDTKQWEPTYLIGGRYDISSKFSLLAEFTNSKSGFENDFNGLASIGIRFRGEYIAWDFAGIRPLNNNSGKFLFFPLIKATVVF